MAKHYEIPADVPAIEVDGLRYSYKSQQALTNTTFTVGQGSIHGFVGPNGAGKTTTLKILATLMKPQAGTARVFGLNVGRLYKKVRERIGFMPDSFGAYLQMTVFEYLDFFAAAYGLSRQERTRTIEDVLVLTDMGGRRDTALKGLSRGMQQRLSLARVLVHDPQLLLLDEPASGLDPRARIELMEILRELRRMGKTVFISSHILAELGGLCDSVTIIDRGTTKYSGPIGELLNHSGEAARYVIRIAEDHDSIEEALRGTPGMLSVAKAPDAPAYSVAFERERLDVNEIARIVLSSGARLVALQPATRELSQAFMDLTEPGVPS